MSKGIRSEPGSIKSRGLQIILCSVYSSLRGAPEGKGNSVYSNLRGGATVAGFSTPTGGSKSNMVRTFFTAALNFLNASEARGSAGLQPGQHPNHFRDPAARMLGAQCNHQI